MYNMFRKPKYNVYRREKNSENMKKIRKTIYQRKIAIRLLLQPETILLLKYIKSPSRELCTFCPQRSQSSSDLRGSLEEKPFMFEWVS